MDPFLALIVLHAVAATVAFGAGLAVIRPPRDLDSGFVRLWAWSLVAMLVFVAGAIAAHWGDLATVTRAVYLGLLGLGGVMVARAWLARRAPDQHHAWIHHVGFTLIALFDGFVIVAAIDLGAPAWVAVIAGVMGVLVGRWFVDRIGRRNPAPVPAQ
ncbi:MAG TPA: hypothetical protein VGT61_10140 [Thermomicrobiales bacterium]|jgi:O-antigen/teichoic acid export membrane protein|nr:hypothetical protein [Thermomicrobiales bacterium]